MGIAADLALLAAASFGFIFLKALQQRNVAFDNYVWVLPTSLCMAAVEVFVIAKIASYGYALALVLTIGIASGTGAMVAMWVHRRWIK